MLVASLRKSSDIRASKAGRSQRLGQFQSKSQIGLKRPIWAERRRRSRLRRARSCSSQSSSTLTHLAAVASAQCARTPWRLSALARACSVSRLLIALILELVVGFEPVRLDGDVAGLDVCGQIDGDGRWLMAQLATALERQTHSVGMRHVVMECLADRGLALGGTGAVEQSRQGDGDGTEIAAALAGAHQQGLACRRCPRQAGGGAVTAGA